MGCSGAVSLRCLGRGVVDRGESLIARGAAGNTSLLNGEEVHTYFFPLFFINYLLSQLCGTDLFSHVFREMSSATARYCWSCTTCIRRAQCCEHEKNMLRTT